MRSVSPQQLASVTALGFFWTAAPATRSVSALGLTSSKADDAATGGSPEPSASTAADAPPVRPTQARSTPRGSGVYTPASAGFAAQIAVHQTQSAPSRPFVTLCGVATGRQQASVTRWGARPASLGGGAAAALPPSAAAVDALQRRCASVQAKDVRVGMLVLEGGSLLSVSKAVHTAGIARQGGIVQLEFRDVRSGVKSTSKAAPADVLQLAETERRAMQLLYRDDEGVHLMDPVSFEQVTVQADVFEGEAASKWIRDGMDVDVLFFDGRPLSAQMPTTLVVRVVDTPTDRLSEANARKAAVVDTGATVMVPPFVQNGEDIVVNTGTGEFVRRASS